jgi:hypothetical protein
MIELLIYIVVLCLIFGLIYYAITLMPLPDPFKNIAMIVILLVFILVLLGIIFGGVNLPKWPPK